MSDDPNRPDADHELDVDISAFLPEGSRFATDDDEVGESAPTDESDDDRDPEGHGEGTNAVDSTDATNVVGESSPGGVVDGGPSDVGASGDAPTSNEALDADADSSGDVDDGWDTGAPAPEIPEWARDDLPPLPVVDGSDQPVDDDSEPAPVADTGPAVPAVLDVNTTVLTRIEGELADVDAAIAAIDAGDLARSPLLTELLASDAPPADATPVDAPDPGTPTSKDNPN